MRSRGGDEDGLGGFVPPSFRDSRMVEVQAKNLLANHHGRRAGKPAGRATARRLQLVNEGDTQVVPRCSSAPTALGGACSTDTSSRYQSRSV